MRPSFLTSILLHGVLLFLLFSWGIPLADKFSAKNIIEVSLIPGETEKPKEKPVRNDKGKKVPTMAKRQETPKPITEKEPPPKEEETIKETVKPEPVQEPMRLQEAEGSPPKPELAEEGQKKTAGRDDHPLSPSSQGLTAERSGPPGPDLSAASFVAAFRLHPEGGGNRVGTRGPESGLEQGKGPSQTSRVHGNPSGSDETLLLILRKIEAAKKYPRKAQKMGIEGKALVRFKMRPNGSVETVELLESSGSEILDQASLETVRNAAPLPYKEGWLKVGIIFKIL